MAQEASNRIEDIPLENMASAMTPACPSLGSSSTDEVDYSHAHAGFKQFPPSSPSGTADKYTVE